MTTDTPTETTLIDAIHAAKAERMKATNRGDLDRVNELNAEIGRLTAEVWRVRKEAQA